MNSVRSLRFLLPALLCLLLAAGFAGKALAHAQLIASQPASGAVVKAAPETLRLTFNEPVSLLGLKWFAPNGREEAVGEPGFDAESLILPVPENAGEGTHLVSYRVTSLDGHVIGGTLAFSIGKASAAPVAGDPADAGASAARLAAAARFLLTLTLTIAAGGAAFFAFPARNIDGLDAPRRFARVFAFFGLFAAPLALGVQGLDLLGLPPGGLLTAAPYQAASAGPFFWTASFSFTACLLAIEALCRRSARLAGFGAWIFAALSFAMFGHAASASPQALMRPAVTLHAAAFLFWLGSLPPLLYAAGRRLPDLARLLKNFSSWAVPLVGLLTATGIAIAFIQVEAPGYLLSTDYGLILGGKIGLFALLLGLAGLNRLILSPDIGKGEGSAARRLAGSVKLEIVLAAVVLVAASSFRLTPPPRAIAAADRAGASAHLHQERAAANVVARPGRRGENRLTLDIFGADGAPLAAKEVSLALSRGDLGLEPIKVKATADGKGAWVSDPVPLTLAGDWSVNLNILVSDFEETSLAGSISIRH
ncbi:copper resistance protein CopC/CopD [Stappia sp. F7233]|uniref:Copper resistance protein CopC/CopD n=1 Tax=Stappia albiluteola TaxID=2758565 RepID=A0A839A9P4_9HYPH|nr:copper resistance protein CopC [Stappia albiluteola]MBA5775906.1 copper resistance protein CopC/CopD [Stappia albiluteola]